MDYRSWKPLLGRGDKPLYLALIEALEGDIQRGLLVPGDKLPPQRELADLLDINLSTVTRAFKSCELKGLISGVVGRGTFIASDAKTSLSLISPERHVGMLDMGQVLPLYGFDKEVAQSVKTLMKEMDLERLICYGEPAGHLRHRIVGAEWLKSFNLLTDPDGVLITAGSQNALAAALLTLFQPGDRIAVETLSYPGLKSLAALYGVRLVPIEMTGEGMSPSALSQACKQDKIKGLYLMPEIQNPTTAFMPMHRREEMAAVIRKYNLILIEDDAYGYTGNRDSTPLSMFAPSQGIYLGGTSKLLGPGFRTSFVKVPQAYMEPMRRGLLNLTWMASPLTTEMVVQLIVSGKSAEILDLKREEARKRNRLAKELLAGYTLASRDCGFYQWLMLPDGWQRRSFEMLAREAGVQVFEADKFMVGGEQPPMAVRLALSGPETLGQVEEGLTIIKKLLQNGPPTDTMI